MISKPTISVFTATFNRRHTIHRVFNSLMLQTFRDFEWIIIDDGSTDNTESLIHEFQQSAFFSIKYLWQRNRGKHTAYNTFAKYASGFLYISVDSDDAILSNCLERLLFEFNSIPEDTRHSYAGVMCLAQDENCVLIGDKFHSNELQDNFNKNSIKS